MLELVLLLVTLILVYRFFNAKPQNFPPGPPTVPFLGSLPFIKTQNFHFTLNELKNKYGPIVGFKFGTINAVGICAPNEVFEALKRVDFNARPSVTIRTRKAEGVMFSNGEHWKIQRRFTLRHLKDFGFGKTSTNDVVQTEFEEFSKCRLENGKEIEVSGLFNASSINVLWAMISGRRFNYDDKKFAVFLNCIERLFRSGSAAGNILDIVPYLKPVVHLFYEPDVDKTNRLVREYLKETIAEHKATKIEVPRDFMDVYISELEKTDEAPSFSINTFVEICRDLFLAGTESSGNTLSFCILYLVLYPEWQEKVFKEIEELSGSPPKLEDKARLPLVDAFISEVFRCNPIAPLTVPHATTKDTDFGGYSLPKDTFVHLSLWSILQDEKHWGDPENFRPDRFLKDGKFVRDPYLIVFGSGSRICLGETLARNFVFLYFTHLVQNFKFALPNGAPKPSTVCQSGLTVAPQKFKVVPSRR